MILRKPYAFLIKNFKLIHLLLFLLIAYSITKTNTLSSFFQDYVTNTNYIYNSTIVAAYLSKWIYFVLGSVIILSLAILILLKAKKKPVGYYILTIIYYLIIFVFVIIAQNVMRSLETELIEAKTIRLYRDLCVLIFSPAYLFAVISLVRGIGFNIKHFNFSKDLEELEIETTDNEEVELKIGIEGYKAERSLRRFIREFKYYVTENKIPFIILSSLMFIIVGSIIFSNLRSNISYKKTGLTFESEVFTINVNNTYITNVDSNGNIIDEKHIYFIADLSITNNSGETSRYDTQNIRLQTNEGILTPYIKYRSKFLDLGDSFTVSPIKSGATKNTLVVFEVPKEDLQTEYTLRTINNVDYSSLRLKVTYNDTTISPIVLISNSLKDNIALNESVVFTNTTLLNTSLKITSYKISKAHNYTYEYCNDSKCYSSIAQVVPEYDKTSYLLILNYELIYDELSTYNHIEPNNIFNDFASLEYTINNKTYSSSLTEIKVKKLTNVYIAEVNSNVLDATNIKLVFNIRNNKFKIILK